MPRWADIVTDQTPQAAPVVGAFVTVKNPDGSLAAITTDSGSIIANSVCTTDGNGAYYFNAAAGVYTLEFRLSLTDNPRTVRQIALGTDVPFTPQQFGAKADGVTDDSAAFVAAIAYLKSIAVNPVINEYKASPKLFIPAGHYYLGTTTLDITHTLIIEGEGGQGIGAGGGAATKLRWAANTTGIRFQAYDTSGASTVISATWSGAYSELRDLYLYGAFVSGTTLEGEYHGIHTKSTIFLWNVTAENFQGDGLYAHTTSGGGSPNEGASNISRAYNCTFRNCRNGRSMAGGDANAWVFVGCNYLYNRACGADDQSFLGNTEIHPHTNGNGIASDNVGSANFPAYVVSNVGNRYCPVQGQEPAASTTAPTGTANTSIWLYLGAGGAGTGIPAWTSGMSLRCGAPYRTNNANACNVFINPYEEGGQGFSQLANQTVMDGGEHGSGVPQGGTYKHYSSGFYLSNNFVAALDSNQFGFGIFTDHFQALNSDGSSGQQTLEWFNGDLCWTVLRSSNPTNWPYQILCEATTNNVGKRHINFPNGYGFANLKHFPGSAMPSTGSWVNGDFIENTSRSELGTAGSKYLILGWQRITTGSGNVLNTDWLQCRALTGN